MPVHVSVLQTSFSLTDYFMEIEKKQSRNVKNVVVSQPNSDLARASARERHIQSPMADHLKNDQAHSIGGR